MASRTRLLIPRQLLEKYSFHVGRLIPSSNASRSSGWAPVENGTAWVPTGSASVEALRIESCRMAHDSDICWETSRQISAFNSNAVLASYRPPKRMHIEHFSG
jgi:hypothetical protein